jgi:hypothetical protein
MQNTYDSHVFTPKIWDSSSPQTANRQFSSFFGPKLPRNSGAKTRNSHAKTNKRAQIGISALMCFDKMYFIAAKLGLMANSFDLAKWVSHSKTHQ